MSWKFTRVAGPFGFAEGPVWDGESVLFTDILASAIMRYVPATGECAPYVTDTRNSNGLRMDAEGRLYACEHSGRAIARYERSGEKRILADRFEGARLNSPNDLAIDSQGRVWFTDPHYFGAPVYGDHPGTLELDHESVYRLDPEPDDTWSIHRMTFDTTKPNGLLLSHDERILYVAQSDPSPERKKELRAYPILADGSLGTHRVLHDFETHRGIDGMTLDESGNIVATAGWKRSGPGPSIYVFAPDGRVLDRHPFPEDMPTNCVFGDADLQSLYITCGADGSLYRTRTEMRGVIRQGIR